MGRGEQGGALTVVHHVVGVDVVSKCGVKAASAVRREDAPPQLTDTCRLDKIRMDEVSIDKDPWTSLW